MDNENLDLENLDKVFPNFHDSGKFDLSSCIPPEMQYYKENGFSYPVVSIIAGLLTKYGYATVKEEFPIYYTELTEKGRNAKAAGGHFDYLQQQANKIQQEAVRQDRRDRIDQVDYLMKLWSYKFRYLLYIASFGGLTVSIFTYFKPEKEVEDIQPIKQKIEKLETKIDVLDSLYRLDGLMKKDTSQF